MTQRDRIPYNQNEVQNEVLNSGIKMRLGKEILELKTLDIWKKGKCWKTGRKDLFEGVNSYRNGTNIVCGTRESDWSKLDPAHFQDSFPCLLQIERQAH